MKKQIGKFIIMKKFYYILSILALLVSGCSQEEMLKTSSASALKFTASFEQDESRTYVEEGNLLRWTEGDQISLFVGSTLNQQYQFAGKTGANSGYFNKIGTSFGTGNDLKCHYAVYPYASGTEISDNGILTVILPSEQSYADNSFGLGDNTMVAITRDIDDTYLRFKNVGGYLKLQLYGDNVTVKTIELKGNNNEKIAGKATVTSTYGGNPSVSMADDATETITLDCGENGVKIGASAETATAFWVVLPPTAFEKGFTVTITDVNGGKFEKATSKQFVVERNVIKPMASIEVKPEVVVDEIPYLTFSADAEQSLKMSKVVETLEYSVDGGEWTELGANIVRFGGDLGKLRVRGKSSIGTAKSTSDYSQITFGNETFVACSGDIRTLLDYENFETVNTGNARFCHLFNNCSNLTKAPELPAKDLADYCYVGMFQLCNNLMQSPELPATKLANWCYTNMFDGCIKLIKASELPAVNLTEYCYAGMYACTNLTESPKLPAINLAQNCYDGMYAGCKNLTKAPELPATIMFDRCYMGMFSDCISLTESSELSATKLANWCYSNMFAGCANLKTSSQLPANTLAEGCYYNMFRNCVSLLQAPELPATILSDYCYYNMFSGCNSLNSITMLATDTSASYCLDNWTEGVSSTGTFIKAKEMEFLPSGSNGIPSGWTVKNYGESTDNTPYLTFKADVTQSLTMSKAVETLEYSVGNGEWKSLETNIVEFGGEVGNLRIRGKSLNGTAAAVEDYSTIVFTGVGTVACSGDIRTLVDYENYESVNTGSARFCRLFYGCFSLTSAPELPATTLAEGCYSNMFYGCTGLTEAPVLPATTLSKGCYSEMFFGCYNLSQAPNLPATTLAAHCYSSMFYGCIRLLEAPELPAMSLASHCYDGMFAQCSNLTKAPVLPAKTLEYACYKNMFNGCKNLTKAPALPATVLANDCYSAMFFCCTNLSQAPVLPAKTLTESCYGCMFYECNSLNQITMLATDISADYCLDNWTEGVASTGTFIKAEEMELLSSGSNGIPSGWTVKNYGESIDNTPYLTFTADAAQTLTMSKAVETLEYSVGNGEWKSLETNTVEFGGELGNLRLRGKSSIGTATTANDNAYATIRFGNDVKVSCNGDVRTLVDYENYSTVNTSNARFCYLFYNCSQLTSAPSLPATTLTTQCYKYMFRGCTSLMNAPELPATKMYSECYGGMFWGCITLTKTPKLPATQLAGWCYYYMFYGCIGLTEAPALPAKDLKEYCYHSMFEGCTNLIVAPQLPATTLTEYCYAYMFHGCISLTTAPTLSAATLVEGCYWNMFSDCSKLNKITMLAMDVSASYCLNNWTGDVASTGTFIKTKAMESLPTGINGIPEGWIIKNYDEE